MKKHRNNKKKNIQKRENHIFRFELEIPPMPSNSSNAVVSIIKENLKAILDVVILTYKGKEVEVDGFKLAENENIIYYLYDECPPLINSNDK